MLEIMTPWASPQCRAAGQSLEPLRRWLEAFSLRLAVVREDLARARGRITHADALLGRRTAAEPGIRDELRTR